MNKNVDRPNIYRVPKTSHIYFLNSCVTHIPMFKAGQITGSCNSITNYMQLLIYFPN